MRINENQYLRQIIREYVDVNHGFDNADPDFPVAVVYGGQSEMAHNKDELENIVASLGPNTPYQISTLEDLPAGSIPFGSDVEVTLEPEGGRSDFVIYPEVVTYSKKQRKLLEKGVRDITVSLNELYHTAGLENSDLLNILEGMISDVSRGTIGEPT